MLYVSVCAGKSASVAVTAVTAVTFSATLIAAVAPPPLEVITGAIFPIVIVVLPIAIAAPPEPCAPALPSLNAQSICTVAGGVTLLFEYAIELNVSSTRADVALALKVSTKRPPLFVVTVPIVTPDNTKLPPCVSALKLPVAENTS